MTDFLQGDGDEAKKKKKFALSHLNAVNFYRVIRMGRNFDDYPGFQPKIVSAN